MIRAMTWKEAKSEALRRWAGVHELLIVFAYWTTGESGQSEAVVGYYLQSPLPAGDNAKPHKVVKGRGSSWERAFNDADLRANGI